MLHKCLTLGCCILMLPHFLLIGVIQLEEPVSGYYAMKEQILILEQQNKEV